jgi:hypothetical protein
MLNKIPKIIEVDEGYSLKANMLVLIDTKKDNWTFYLQHNEGGSELEENSSAKVVTVITIYILYSSATNYLQLVQSAMLGLHGLMKY